MMKNPSFYYILLQLFVLSQLLLHCCCQQEYLNNTVYDCESFDFKVNAGYVCGVQEVACVSFLTFRSRPPYDTLQRISDLLNTDVASIVSINNISSRVNQNIPSNQTVIVPISCLCSGNTYQHATRYTIKPNDTTCKYLVSTNFQGLTSCPMLQRQIYYTPFNIDVGSQIIVPVLCACPTHKQISDGVSHLLVHTLEHGDTIHSVAEAYGVDQQSLLAANELSSNATVFALTPILVPLKRSACKFNPHLFYCTCSFYQSYNPESFKTPDCDYLRHSHRFPIKLVASIGVGTGAVFLCLFLLGYKLHQCLKQKQEKVRKEKLFRQNGGILLQEKMSSYGHREKAKHFTAEELEKATDNYNQSRFLGQGGFGTVYKGMLPDGTIVAVKKSKDIVINQIETFINEVTILSQINHRNIVKLLGCCLETEAPLLVYEFIPNGTLSHHIHNQELEANLSWDARLRIACEVAGAVAYMHSAASIPIFHRDIKTSNILLDYNYNAKVSDFGTSRSVPDDRTHLTTVVQGTFGYIDPEYFQSSQFTNKSDVYSFGVVLVELITGRKPITFSEENQGQNLVAEFISLIKVDQVFEIFDTKVVHEGRKDDLLGIANLALRCLRLNGKKRPTMREVSVELEALGKTESSLKIIERSLEFPQDRKSTEQGTTSESDEEFKEENPSLFFQIDSISI